MSSRWNARISEGNSSTTPLLAAGAEIITFRAASSAGTGAATSLVIPKPVGVVQDDVMVALVAQAKDQPAPFFVASAFINTTATVVLVPKPAGTAVDDVMIAKISVTTQETITPPAGWTTIRDDLESANGPRQGLFFKRATTADDPLATYSFNVSLGQTRGVTGTIATYRDVILTGSPIDAHGGQFNVGGLNSITAPSITTTGPKRMLIACFTAIDTDTVNDQNYTPPAGMTERTDKSVEVSSRQVSSELADQVLNDVGATGTRTATTPTLQSVTETIGALVALKPLTPSALATVTPPAGWTTIRTDDTNYRSSLYWKRAGAAEPADYTWTFSAAVDAAGVISAYDGVTLLGDPTDVHSGTTQQNIAHTSVTAPSVITTAVNAMLLGFFGGRVTGDVAATWTAPVGMMQRKEQSDGTATTPISIEIADQFISTVGATGSRTATASQTLDNSVGNLVALKPDTTGSPIFFGAPEEVSDFSALRIYLSTNRDSALLGLTVEWSTDGVNFDTSGIPDTYNVVGNRVFSELLPVRTRFFRLQYRNGATAQTFFRLQTTLLPEADQPFPRSQDRFDSVRAENILISPGVFRDVLIVSGADEAKIRHVRRYSVHPTVVGAPVTFVNKYRVRLVRGAQIVHTAEVGDIASGADPIFDLDFTPIGSFSIQVRHDEAADRNFDAWTNSHQR